MQCYFHILNENTKAGDSTSPVLQHFTFWTYKEIKTLLYTTKLLVSRIPDNCMHILFYLIVNLIIKFL